MKEPSTRVEEILRDPRTSMLLMKARLIMLLIFGDAMRASWYFIFAVVAIARGNVPTLSGFCQASGFLLYLGTKVSGDLFSFF